MKKKDIVFDKDEKILELNLFLKILIILPFTNILGIDRFVLKDYKSAFLKLAFLFTPVFLVYYILDLVKLFKNKYNPNILKYFKQDFTFKQFFFISFYWTNHFGVDRFIYGYKLAGLIRFLFGTLLIFGFVLYFIDFYKLLKGKYDWEEII